MTGKILQLVPPEKEVKEILDDCMKENYEIIVVIGVHKRNCPVELTISGTFSEANLLLDIAKAQIIEELFNN